MARFLAVGHDATPYLNVYDADTWVQESGTPTLDGSPLWLAFSYDDAYLAVITSASPYLRVYDTSDWSTVAGTPTVANASKCEFSKDGTQLAIVTSSSPYLTILDTSDWSTVAGTPTLAGTGIYAQYNHDDTRLAVAHFLGNGLTIYDTSTWSAEAGTPDLGTYGVYLSYNSDGSRLAVITGASPYLVVYNTSTWAAIAGTPVLTAPYSYAVYNNDDSLLAVSSSFSSHGVTVYETSGWTSEASGLGSTYGTTHVDFSENGALITYIYEQTGGFNDNFTVRETTTWGGVAGAPFLPASEAKALAFSNATTSVSQEVEVTDTAEFTDYIFDEESGYPKHLWRLYVDSVQVFNNDDEADLQSKVAGAAQDLLLYDIQIFSSYAGSDIRSSATITASEAGEGANVLANAYDGDTVSTYYQVVNADLPAWIQFDFPSEQLIDHLRYKGASNRIYSARLQYFDGAYWVTDCAGFTYQENVSTLGTEYAVFPIKSDRWQFRITSARTETPVGSPDHLYWNELQSFTREDLSTNLSLTATATATEEFLSADFALDDNPVTKWASGISPEDTGVGYILYTVTFPSAYAIDFWRLLVEVNFFEQTQQWVSYSLNYHNNTGDANPWIQTARWQSRHFKDRSFNIWAEMDGLEFVTGLVERPVFHETLEGTTQDADALDNDVAQFTDQINSHVEFSVIEYGAEFLDPLTGEMAMEVSHTDNATFTDTLAGTPTAAIADSAEFTESLTALLSTSVVDIVEFSETTGGLLSITSTLEDACKISDTILAHLTGIGTDAIAFTEIALTEMSSGLNDAAEFIETTGGVLAISKESGDSIQATDQLASLISAPLENEIEVSEGLAGVVASSAPAMDAPNFSDVLSGNIYAFGTLIDEVNASDVAAGDLSLIGILSDVAIAGDALYEQRQQVLVINAETGAISNYIFTPVIQGVGQLNGTLYLATDAGLYALDAADDNGASITWEARTGFNHLGTDKLKRVNDVNTLLRADADTALIIVVNRSGEKKEHHYKLVTATRAAMRDGVTKAGKGLQSVYWQFGYKGVNEAEIDEIRVYPEVLTRRR